MSPGNPFIWGQKVKDLGPEAQKHCRRKFLHSCESWLVLVILSFYIKMFGLNVLCFLCFNVFLCRPTDCLSSSLIVVSSVWASLPEIKRRYGIV